MLTTDVLLSLPNPFTRWPKTMFLKALGPFLACVIGIIVVVAGKWTNGKGPIKIVKNIPHGEHDMLLPKSDVTDDDVQMVM